MKTKNGKRALSVLLLILAVALICAGAALAAGSAARISDKFVSEMNTPEISIALLENGEKASGEDKLLKEFLGDDGMIKIGKMYPETLSVQNTAKTAQYVRMTVRKYWLEDSSDKRVDLAPELIKLELGKQGWIVDEAAMETSSPERIILYYTKPLGKDDISAPAVTSIGLDTDVALYIEQTVTETQNGKTITTTYDYDGLEFGIEADVDGIQTHSAEDAAKSAWGVDISIANDGTLSLK